MAAGAYRPQAHLADPSRQYFSPNAIKSVAEGHISWSVLVLLPFVAVHKHLFNVYSPFMMILWVDLLWVCDVFVRQPKKRHCRFLMQIFAIYYRGLGKFVIMKAVPTFFFFFAVCLM